MSDIADLNKKRGTCKGRLTNFEKFIKGFVEISRCTEVEALEIKLRMDKMQSNFEEFHKIQSAIENLAGGEEESQYQEVQRSEFESTFYKTMARAQELYRLYKRSFSGHSSSSSSANDDSDTVKGTKSDLKGVKLPTIQIPKFSGEYANWLEFRDTFVSLIHSNSSISNIQKFHYLRASLEGGAAQIIRSLEFSASSYSIAWSLLCERYDNTRLLIQNHIKAIFNEEQVKRESADLLRKLLDSYTKNLRSLEILGEPTRFWDTLIIYIICSKLDARTLREWEEHKSAHKKLSLKILTQFLKNRADLLETMELGTKTQTTHASTSYKPNKNLKALAASAHHVQNKIYLCPLCNEEHSLYHCEKFLKMNLNDRSKFVYQKGLCANCFRSGHHKRVCRLGPCKTCKRKHNTLLHRDEDDANQQKPVALWSNKLHSGNVLLTTAIVKVRDYKNNWHEVRAVLDSGSQASFMTEALLAELSLKSQSIELTVAGINNSVSSISKQCNTEIQSRLNSYTIDVAFLVLPCITTSSNVVVDINKLEIPSNVTLADPNFYSPSSLDLLLGADIFWDLLEANQIRVNNNYPVLQETKFGYIVSGPIRASRGKQVSCNLSQFDELQEQLAKFWLVEEIPEFNKPVFSLEEKLCEEHFNQNMSREKDGRFSVAIPLKIPETSLGDSYTRAERCFLSLERRLQKQVKLKSMYNNFMQEYIQLGHMTKSDNKNISRTSYFLPHHGVLREQSTTTKLRVVFNASSPTTSGLSLNDIQMVGPTIQSDLVSILLRFRQHRYVLVGDVEKMYRQVLINKDQRHLQQIIWRDDPSKQLDSYTLNTVTYGTASAPFLAVRCLKQLADECKNTQIREIISDDFYMDDLLTGDATVEGLLNIKKSVTEVLASGNFNLRKFRSNLPTSSDTTEIVDLDEHGSSTALGLKWSPADDQLYFVIKDCQKGKLTKRVILSTISQVFDPLGLLSIFIITGKIILQRLWLHKLQWDDPLPADIVHLWSKFVTQLAQVNEMRIPRLVLCNDPKVVQLHAFADASKDAYGACIYVRSEDTDGHVAIRILCAKSRVAPLRANTIPRLELCGAAAAAKILLKVLTTTRLNISKCFLWTDSSIVLGWLKTPPNKLKQFVKNRVSTVQEMTHNHEWRHVPTACNPADLLSRGVAITDHNQLKLWWNGPQFLSCPEDEWPNKRFDNKMDLPEVIANVAVHDGSNECFPFSRFSNLHKIYGTMAYILRFINNCRNRGSTMKGPISHLERETARTKLLQLAQIDTFFDEYSALSKGKPLSTKNKYLSLNPFLDETGLIRVGGRIKNGNFNFDKKHPVLLTSKHKLTRLLFEHEHLRLMHAGPQLLLSSMREQIWPLGGRSLAKQVVHQCLRCFRFNAKNVKPIMGNLPQQRLQPGYAFQTAGMDYAGPITALNRRGRGSKTVKVYIAIFVCFTTRAIHIELVSDLTKDAFLSALRRFIARRSKPLCLVSDNGTQFVGARNELSSFIKSNADSIIDTMSQENIDFKFIPAYSPHMAGLAEAGVKSVKAHLRRILGNAHLVFEDLYTVLVQIEAILNSRPLTALSTDPHDLTPLTPGHFLVGRALTALPTPNLLDQKETRLNRYERLEHMRQQFWARWHKEYLSELQQRTKWRASSGTLQEGALVLIKDNLLPPMKWHLGRVVNVYPGADGVARVADLRTAKGTIRRAFNNIYPLPIQDELKDKAFNAGGHVKN